VPLQHLFIVVENLIQLTSVALGRNHLIIVLLKVELSPDIAQIISTLSCELPFICFVDLLHPRTVEPLITLDICLDLLDLSTHTVRELKRPIIGIKGTTSVLKQ